MKTLDGRHSRGIDIERLAMAGKPEIADFEAYLVHLADKLALEVLAVVERQAGGKSAKVTVAGQDGGYCELEVPGLDNGGELARLIRSGRPEAGRAKLFAREEVFPARGAWCDVIPMDSTVTYVFLPIESARVRSETQVQAACTDQPSGQAQHPGAARSGAPPEQHGTPPPKFVLAAATTGEPGDSELALKALASGSLVSFSVAASEVHRLRRVVSKQRTLVSGYDSHSERFKLLSRFMSSVAHEIKNPLTGISAGVQYLAKKLQPGLAEDETVEFILAEISRLNRIVDDLYKIAKPPELVLQPVNINEVIAKSLLCLSEDILMKRLTVQQDLEEGLPQFQADPDRLQQILVNIVKNAIEATPEGGSISIETARKVSNLILKVTDSGCGIAEEVIERVFEPFYSTKEGGTGLGLCISQRIVQEHGGAIYIEKPEQGGTSFVIELPLGDRDGESTGNR